MRNAASSVEDEEERDVCLDLDFCLAIVLFGELGLFWPWPLSFLYEGSLRGFSLAGKGDTSRPSITLFDRGFLSSQSCRSQTHKSTFVLKAKTNTPI